MALTTEHANPGMYLGETGIMDYSNPLIADTARGLERGSVMETALAVYSFVRDGIGHSVDIGAQRVTCAASEVLAHRHGICFAKAHLLAALLRRCGIPAGFCYQLLIFDDEHDRRLVPHGLNAVYPGERYGWVRIDARGNKPGVDAQFDVNSEKLAFPVRMHLGEADEKIIWTDPKASILECFRQSGTVEELIANLPSSL
jgi:transglutaminase-like putative cysteine protease